jgi:hypothetical protein
MKREEMIHTPERSGSVRVLGTIDAEQLKQSLQSFIDNAQTGITQQGLRWAGDFEGISDLRYSTTPKKIGEEDCLNDYI